MFFSKVWNHDLFLTDDFLGQVTIPLKEVPVQEWDQDADTAATGECPGLRCRCHGITVETEDACYDLRWNGPGPG